MRYIRTIERLLFFFTLALFLVYNLNLARDSNCDIRDCLGA
jgi:hypothetical protein